MSKIMFSLLVHEEPLVVLDQITNIFKYNPNSYVVMHFNPIFKANDGQMTLDELMVILNKIPNVFINDNRISVCKDDIIQAHISNFYFVKDVDFDYFYFIASNELFLRSGAEAFVSNYEFGCETLKKEKWHYYDYMKSDAGLCNIFKNIGSDEYYYSQIEGSFYSKKIISTIMDIINKSFDYREKHDFYPRDEVYFSTIAGNLFHNTEHYNGCLCKIKWQGKILFTPIRTVKKIINKKSDYFSVKRVDRKIDDYLRNYIRHYVLKYDVDFQKYYQYEFKKKTLFKIYMLNYKYSIMYFFRDKIAKTYRFIFRKK